MGKRWFHDCVISTMVFPILVRQHLHTEPRPCFSPLIHLIFLHWHSTGKYVIDMFYAIPCFMVILCEIYTAATVFLLQLCQFHIQNIRYKTYLYSEQMDVPYDMVILLQTYLPCTLIDSHQESSRLIYHHPLIIMVSPQIAEVLRYKCLILGGMNQWPWPIFLCKNAG